MVTGVHQPRRELEVPDTLGGAPVTGIAPNAFQGDSFLRSISLPPSLLSVGAFAFHDCSHLEEITLYDGIRDFHTGAIRHDLKLEQIRLYVREGNFTVMRDILSDTDAMLRFFVMMPEGEARLLFPGYDYAFAENTMARTIQFTISGCGMTYRECVRRKGIGWREYDRQFCHVIPDDPRAAALIAADRLLYPYDLAPAHKKAYEEYLESHAAQALEQFVRGIEAARRWEEDGYARLSLMAELGLITGEAANGALRLASELKMTRACGILLSGREKELKKRRPAQAVCKDTPTSRASSGMELKKGSPAQAEFVGLQTLRPDEEGLADRQTLPSGGGTGGMLRPEEGMLSLDDW